MPVVVPRISKVQAFTRFEFEVPGDSAHTVEVLPPRGPVVKVPPLRLPARRNGHETVVLQDVNHFCLAVVVGCADVAQNMPRDFQLGGAVTKIA